MCVVIVDQHKEILTLKLFKQSLINVRKKFTYDSNLERTCHTRQNFYVDIVDVGIVLEVVETVTRQL